MQKALENIKKLRLTTDVKNVLHLVNYYKLTVPLIDFFIMMIKSIAYMVSSMMQLIKLQGYICVKMNVCMDI